MVLKPEKVSLPGQSDETDIKQEFPDIKSAQTTGQHVIMPGNQAARVPDPEYHENNLPVPEKNTEKEPVSNSSQNKKNENDKDTSLPVVYSGVELIRSKIKAIGKKNEELVTTIRGKALIKQGKMQMKSHEIRLIGENSDTAISDYPVRIKDSKSNTEITAGYGKFTKKDNMAYFSKKPELNHIDPKTGEKTKIKGDEMFHFFKNGVSVVYGHVIIESDQNIAYSKKATYYKDDDRIELEGNPEIYEKNNIYKSDKMILYRKDKKAILSGHSQVITLEEKEKDEKSNEGTVKTIILSDNAEYNYGIKPKTTIFSTTRPNGFVYVFREDSDLYCRKAIARGENSEEIDLFENIYILDKKNRTRLFGEYSEYRKPEEKIRVYTKNNSEGKTIQPEVYFYNDLDELTGQMKGEIFERHLGKKITYARGNIQFKLYEKKTSPHDSDSVKNEVYGQWAEVEDTKREINIYGNPFIKKEDKNIYAGKIIIYPDENRLDMQHSIKGNF